MVNNIIKEKFCKYCKIIKSTDLFHKSSTIKDGFRNICKKCRKIEHHNHYILNKERYKENSKIWKQNNKEKFTKYWKKYALKRKEYFKQYRINHREERAFNEKERRKNDINYKLTSILRHRIYLAIKSKNAIKSDRTLNLLGCDIQTLKLYITSQFENGMSWENYGRWHIDHKTPCSSFDLTKAKEQQKCFHYTNMQPLWATDNFHKWKN